MMPHMQVDKGGVRHILSGSDVMAPGITSEGGKIDDEAKLNGPVAIMAEGKTHAMGIGVLRMETAEIREKNKGKAIESIHFLNDCLWRFKF